MLRLVSFREYLKEWWKALLLVPQLIRWLPFRSRVLEDELRESTLRGSLRRALASWDLVALGVGQVVGSGVFLLTGQAVLTTGPAVVISYFLAGAAAMLAATCYAEFSMEYPVAGAGFTYIMLTFGELPAWITVSNLLLEYVLGTAAVARGFSTYLSRLISEPSRNPHPAGMYPKPDVALDCHSETHIYPQGMKESEDRLLLVGDIDFLAFGIVVLLTAIVASGVRECSLVITVLTVVQTTLLLATMVAGFTMANPDNLSPFLRGGTDNMFSAGAVLFFCYAGFDVVASAAEESKKLEHVPKALLSTTLISTIIYILYSLMLVMMWPTTCIAQISPFAKAFAWKGMRGMYYATCVTALFCIVTSLLVGLYGTARIVMVAARDWLIPPVLASIYPRTQTPVLAQLAIGLVIAVLAMLIPFDTLSDLVSIGLLLVMVLVANALMFRRYYPGLPRLRYSRWGTVESAEGQSLMPFTVPGSKLNLTLPVRQWLVIGHMALINAISIGMTIYYRVRVERLSMEDKSHRDFSRWQVELWLCLTWVLSTLSFQLLCPLEYEPPKWRIPWWLMPWLPSAAVLLMTFIFGSLQSRSNLYLIFACWIGGSLLVYLVFSLPMSYLKHNHLDYVNNEQMNVVELTYEGGRWSASQSSFMKGPAASLGYSGSRAATALAAEAASRRWTLGSFSPSTLSTGRSTASAMHMRSEATGTGTGTISPLASTGLGTLGTPPGPRPSMSLEPSGSLATPLGSGQCSASEEVAATRSRSPRRSPPLPSRLARAAVELASAGGGLQQQQQHDDESD